ncbi:MAG: DUF2277 domain-containing protein [Sandaracinaceae bacterium]
MCRNIKLLYNFAPPATPDEIQASALQYVRKVSGMRTPSSANADAFERAVREITAITERLLLDELETRAAPRNRDAEREKARARGVQREERMRQRLLEG